MTQNKTPILANAYAVVNHYWSKVNHQKMYSLVGLQWNNATMPLIKNGFNKSLGVILEFCPQRIILK